MKDWIIKKDNVCPATGEQCDDECCPPGAECNLKDSDNIQRPVDIDLNQSKHEFVEKEMSELDHIKIRLQRAEKLIKELSLKIDSILK